MDTQDNVITPKQWSVKTETTENEREVIQSKIKKEAEDICKRRKSSALSLEQQIKGLDNKKSQLITITDAIKASLGYETDPQKKAVIEKLCEEILTKTDSYRKKLFELQKRFANQKIRVLSFGNKSQGKSSFTKAYTNLSDAIVGTKPDNDNDDKTGTTSIIIHKEGIPVDCPEIYVVFKRPEAILNTVNECFLSLGMKYHYSSWEELYNVLENTKNDQGERIPNDEKKRVYDLINSFKQDPEKPIKGFGSITETLRWIFKPTSDFFDVNLNKEEYFDLNKGKKVSLKDLAQYNDMTNQLCQSFTSVAEIHIFVDMGHNGMFENIEICDTKGISIEAGGSEWEKELYEIISQSDAVFSIQATGVPGPSDSKFYEDLNTEKANNSGLLKDMELKHFAIINPWGTEVEIQERVEKVAKKVKMDEGVVGILRKSGNVNTIYIGPLKDGVVYDGKKCKLQDFVDYVIHDMMKKIVVTTNITDQKLLDETKSLESDIKTKQDELVKQLSAYDTIPPRNEDEIIHDSIGRWLLKTGIPNVKAKIREVANKAGVPVTFMAKASTNEASLSREHFNSVFDDEDEDTIVDENISRNDEYAPNERIIYKESELGNVNQGIYEVITGDPKIPSELEGKSEKEIVEAAISTLFNRIKANIGKKKGLYGSDIEGTWVNVGSYIDDASILICREIIDNVNRKFAPDQKLYGSQDFKDELFKKIWDCLNLNLLYGDFNGTILKKEEKSIKLANRRLENWSIPYNLSATIPSAAPLLPPPSYVILKHYFDSAEKSIDFGSCDYDQKVIKENDLITAFQKAYIIFDFPTRYRAKKSEEYKWKADLCQHLWADVEDSASFSEEMIELYKYSCPSEFVHKLTVAGILDKSIEEECDNQRKLLDLKNQRKTLSDFSL